MMWQPRMPGRMQLLFLLAACYLTAVAGGEPALARWWSKDDASEIPTPAERALASEWSGSSAGVVTSIAAAPTYSAPSRSVPRGVQSLASGAEQESGEGIRRLPRIASPATEGPGRSAPQRPWLPQPPLPIRPPETHGGAAVKRSAGAPQAPDPVSMRARTNPIHSKHQGSMQPAQRLPRDIVQRASAAVQNGMGLMGRRAYYSGRAEFIQALRMIAQARDAQSGQTTHSQALSNALRALREAKDFVPHNSSTAADVDVRVHAAGHRTPVLHGTDPSSVTPLVALQSYYAYAQEQLAFAAGSEPVASEALFALGKLSLLIDANASSPWIGGPTAMAFYQAALVVRPSNWSAANELGVLMARYGQLRDARRVLLQSIAARGTPEAWNNLAVVHRRLGEVDLAARAEYEGQLARGSPQKTAKLPAVQWVEPSEFTQLSSAKLPSEH